MASYWVIGADGQMYGPADEATLAGWAGQGRVTAQSMLQDAATNQRVYASQLPALAGYFAPAPAPAAAAHQQPAAYQQPIGYQQQQTAIPMAAGYAYQQPAAYQQHAAYQQPVAQAPLGYANPYAPVGASQHQLTTFPVALIVVLHFITFGLFTFYTYFIHFNLMHGKLPVRRPDDPSAGKAIGFMFIPFFNIYWVFFTYLRLCDRINEERVAAGLPPTAPKGMFLAAIICCFIPLVNYVSLLILVPIFFGMMQSCVNELVLRTRGPAA